MNLWWHLEMVGGRTEEFNLSLFLNKSGGSVSRSLWTNERRVSSSRYHSQPIRGQYPGHMITSRGGQMNSKSHTQGRVAIYFWAIDWCWRCRDKKCVDLSCNHHQQPAGTSSARLFICPLKERESSSNSLRGAMMRRQTDLIWSIQNAAVCSGEASQIYLLEDYHISCLDCDI